MILKAYSVTVLKHPKKLPTTGLYDGKTVLVIGPMSLLAKGPTEAAVKAALELPDASDIDELDFKVMELGQSAGVGTQAGGDF